MGGPSSTTERIEGRERYGVIVRYPRELQRSTEDRARGTGTDMSRGMMPLGQVARIEIVKGAPAILKENALLSCTSTWTSGTATWGHTWPRRRRR